MEENLDITKPRFSEPVLPVPWPFIISRFHSTGFRILVSGNWISNSNRKRELGFLELNSLDSGFYQ